MWSQLIGGSGKAIGPRVAYVTIAMAAYREQLRDTPNDIPPNSRLFVIAGRGIKEDEYRECFSKYGQVEDIWIVKDRRTNEEKGVFVFMLQQQQRNSCSNVYSSTLSSYLSKMSADRCHSSTNSSEMKTAQRLFHDA